MNFDQQSHLLKPAITIQLIHILLSVSWNIVSVTLVYMGGRALGPTSSLMLASILLFLALCLWLASKKSAIAYGLISLLQLFASFSTVSNAFTKDPSLWPADISRYVGVAINLIGVFGAMLGLYLLFVIIRKSQQLEMKKSLRVEK